MLLQYPPLIVQSTIQYYYLIMQENIGSLDDDLPIFPVISEQLALKLSPFENLVYEERLYKYPLDELGVCSGFVHWVYPAYDATVVLLVASEFATKNSTVFHMSSSGSILGRMDMMVHPQSINRNLSQCDMLRDDKIMMIAQEKALYLEHNSVFLVEWDLRTYEQVRIAISSIGSICEIFTFPHNNTLCIKQEVPCLEHEPESEWLDTVFELKLSSFSYSLQHNQQPLSIHIINKMSGRIRDCSQVRLTSVDYKSSTIALWRTDHTKNLQFWTLDFEQANKQIKHSIQMKEDKKYDRSIFSILQQDPTLLLICLAQTCISQENRQTTSIFLQFNVETGSYIRCWQQQADNFILIPGYSFHRVRYHHHEVEQKTITRLILTLQTLPVYYTDNQEILHIDEIKNHSHCLKSSVASYNPKLRLEYQTDGNDLHILVKQIRDHRLQHKELIAMWLLQVIGEDCDEDLMSTVIDITQTAVETVWGPE